MIKHGYKKTLLILSVLGLMNGAAHAQVFFPWSPDDLIFAVITANSNGEDDIIDLGGKNFVFETAYAESSSALPAITPDNHLNTSSHSLTIKNGYLDASLVGTSNFNHITVNANARLYVENVKFEHGVSVTNGGSINNLGFLGVKNSAFIGNNAVALGGAIYNDGTLSIGDSTFSLNYAANGGAIYNDSAGEIYQLFNATFAYNSASADGGAIYNNYLILSMTNNTLNKNNAATDGGGIYISASGVINIFISNIVAANTAVSANDIYIDSGVFITTGGVLNNPQYNLISDSTDNNITGETGNNIVTGDPGLEMLQNNGGFVWTMALIDSSPAINAGANPLALQWDARGYGFARENGGVTDIGAYELQISGK